MKTNSELTKEYAHLSEKLIVPKNLINVLGFVPKFKKIEDNFYCSGNRNPLSILYLNNAYFLFKLLKRIDFDKNNITEIGSGDSLVVDLALKYYGFSGTLQKVNLDIPKLPKLETKFKVNWIRGDIFSEVQNIPLADALIFNHSIDDLYIHLWSLDFKKDYFNFMCNIKNEFDIKKDTNHWKGAIRRKKIYARKIKNLFLMLSQRLKKEGLIIIRCYPSSYEVYHNQGFRMKFHKSLTLRIVGFLINNGFKLILDDSNKIDARFELSRTYFVLQKV